MFEIVRAVNRNAIMNNSTIVSYLVKSYRCLRRSLALSLRLNINRKHLSDIVENLH